MPAYTVEIRANSRDSEVVDWMASGEMHAVSSNELRDIRKSSKLLEASLSGQQTGYAYEVRVGPDPLDKPFAIASTTRGGARAPKEGDGRVVYANPARAGLTLESDLLERAKGAATAAGLSLNQWAAAAFERALAE